MGDGLTIGVVASPREWRTDLQSHVRDHVSEVCLKVLREPRAVFDEHVDVVVIDDVASFLNRHAVRRLQEQGVRVVGVFDPSEDEGRGETFLAELGVDLTLTADASAEELLAGISSLGPASRVDAELDALWQGLGGAEGAAPTASGERGAATVIVVGGPPGGPGTTEVAIGVAAALFARRERCVLVDLDGVAPSVARRLLYQLEPNVLTSLHVLRRGGALLSQTMGARSAGAGGQVGFDVVPGLATPTDWREWRESEVALLVSALHEGAHVVLDVGSQLEEHQVLGRERFGPQRVVAAQADAVIGVCRPDPLGLLRFLEWAAQVHELSPERPIWVVLNREPKARFKQAQVEEQLHKNMAPELLAAVISVPDDPRVAQAGWDGTLVARGPFTRSMAELVAGVAPQAMRPGRRRRLTAKGA